MSLNPHTIRHIPAEEKVRSFGEMPTIIRRLGNAGITVVLAQGVFDMVHLGHVGYLRASRTVDAPSGFVVVGVENDAAVRRNKGDTRPINPLQDRLQMLAEFMSVGLVFGYEDTPRYDEPQDYVERYGALSSAAIAVPTWDPHRNLKEWQANEAGTNLAFVDYHFENSTTQMLRRVGYEE